MGESAAMELSPDVQAVIRRRLTPEIADSFLALARPSVGQAISPDASAVGSMIGGEPRTRKFTWPLYRAVPMLLLTHAHPPHPSFGESSGEDAMPVTMTV